MTIFKTLAAPALLLAILFLGAESALAQAPSTPGVPNASLGGSHILSFIIMMLSAGVVVGGVLYIRRHLIAK